MSLVKIQNSDNFVDMNDLEYLTFTEGWNGGQWSCWDVLRNLDKYKTFAVTSDVIVELPCEIKVVHGVDCDMGHQYSWKSDRLSCEVRYLGRKLNVDAIDLINSGVCIMFTKLEKVKPSNSFGEVKCQIKI